MAGGQAHVESLVSLVEPEPDDLNDYRTYEETVRIGGWESLTQKFDFPPPLLGPLTAWFVMRSWGSRPRPFLSILPCCSFGDDNHLIGRRAFSCDGSVLAESMHLV